jgi:peptidoglycan/xylan/chitin deacetylase (PgdA/CDA1 family)
MKNFLLIFLITFSGMVSNAQNSWNNKKCAVVLTYDDALDIDLDHVIPALDSFNLKGTFYLIGNRPAIANRIPEWRAASKNGHELGNHTLFHPCDGTLPGREWVNKDNDLRNYTVNRAVDEIKSNNILLSAIDGKTKRTFAYPCGDLKIGGAYFYDQLKTDFVGARGVTRGLQDAKEVNLDNINTYSMNGQNGEYMINLVKEAVNSEKLLVFLFHGVGGGHKANVTLEAHHKLISFLKAHQSEIWVAPMVDVAEFIKTKQ